MWWPLLAMSDARAVDVCSTCPYPTVQAAIDDGRNVVTLTDAEVTSPFSLLGGQGLTVIGAGYPTTTLRPAGEGDTMIGVGPGASLTLSNVVLDGNAAPSIIVDGATLAASFLWFQRSSVGISAKNLAVVTVDYSIFEDGAGVDGAGLTAISGSTVSINGSSFARMEATGRGGAIFVEDADLLVYDSVFDANSARTGGAIAAEDATVSILTAGYGSLFMANRAVDDGGAIAATRGSLTVAGLSSLGNGSGARGGSLAVRGGDLDLAGATFFGDSTVTAGGAVWVGEGAGRVSLRDSTFDLLIADRGGALAVDGAAEVELSAASFVGTLASFGHGGGASIVDVGTLRVDASRFDVTAAAGRGGGIHVAGTAEATVTGTAFCSSEALAGGDGRGGALSLEGSCGDGCLVESNLFVDPLADEASLLYVSHGDVIVRNATVIHARTLAPGGGLAMADGSGQLRLEGAVIVNTGGDGLVTRDGGLATAGEIVVDVGAAAVWSGHQGDVLEEVPTREERVQLLAVPQASMNADLPCGRESRIHPTYALYQGFQGTDFGAYGGAGQVASWQDDLDGDGAPWVYDCDDTDALVSGFLPELCGNGVDDDCDGQTDGGDDSAGLAWYTDRDHDGAVSAEPIAYTGCDPPDGHRPEPGDDCDDDDPGNFPGNLEVCNYQDDDCDGAADEDPSDAPTWVVDLDGDGFGVPIVACEEPHGSAPGAASGDCDDVDPTIHPEATELDGDGIDQDCDASDAEGFVAGGACGCDGAGGAPLGALALLALVGQRRRSSSGRGPISTSGRAQKS